MNLLIENGTIEELECGANFAYVLNDNSLFMSTEYKVLQSQTNGSFIKCMKMLYNGKLELFYLVNSLKPLSSLIGQLDANHLTTVISNIFAGIIEVKNIGFLTCNNIDISFEHIFVDQNTYKVGLVYIPLLRHEYRDVSSFENALRANLVKKLSVSQYASSAKIAQLCTDLQNGMLTIEKLYAQMGGKSNYYQPKELPHDEERPDTAARKKKPQSAYLRLVALNGPTGFAITVSKPDFLIGKKDTNDGIVDFNKMISRVHCRITCKNNSFFIGDMQSANGTFVNGVKIQPDRPVQIKNGDIVRMANSDFQVVTE